ncbi:hypothetical protein CSW98_08785 [Vibrio sp. HA2012]|uniref:HisA/HisF-related TIM barrel protein n=1 Tax=Vibrio sp. HA2012 TaxID=1971595 RepID=UPI000C2C1CFB|nr:HisA/HisF-related TIM barrel protein [Vibrio sp. HA2012]PJC86304.1 hypothetical protein CSW98_08785 [Vibrio sp. HA2012]
MRIGATVLLSEQQCVQSYEWNRVRPLGSLQGVLDSLEEYHCDEVTIIRPVRHDDTLLQFQQDIEVITALKTMTPISFGGGIRSVEHLKLFKDLPIERLVFSSAFLEKNRNLIVMANELFGRQAIQCLLPVAYRGSDVVVYHCSQRRFIPFSEIDIEFIDELANEVVLFDILHEGSRDKFDWALLEGVPFPFGKLIISGGVGEKTLHIARQKNLASVLIDNKVLHQEYSISGYKHATVLS